MEAHVPPPDSSQDEFVQLHIDSLNSSEIKTQVNVFIAFAKWVFGQVTPGFMAVTHNFSLQSKTLTHEKWLHRSLYEDPSRFGIPNNFLIISCEIRTTSTTNCEIPKRSLQDDFGELFKSGQFSDITISVNGSEFGAHKAILSARSAVFRAMFSHQMKENTSNKLEINDMDEEVAKELFHFIYNGRAPNLNEMATELFVAADKYGIESLKDLCQETMTKSLSVDNAVCTLILAELHGAVELKTDAIDFITANASKVMDTPEWKTEIPYYPNLLMEAFRTVVNLLEDIEKREL